jgi:hypothetical protein
MDATTVALLVTWIMPGGAEQPNVINSYQSTFASVEPRVSHSPRGDRHILYR